MVQELCALLGISIQIFILFYPHHLCDSTALCFVLNGAAVIELYVIKFASTSDMCFTGFFLQKKIYHSIYLICVILTHMVSSWKVEYLLTYLQFTMSAKSSKLTVLVIWASKKLGFLKIIKYILEEGFITNKEKPGEFCQKQDFWLEPSYKTQKK